MVSDGKCMLGNYELKNGTGTIPGSPSSLTAYYNESKHNLTFNLIEFP